MTPIDAKTNSSNPVSELKWDAAPRHVCIAINAVSTTLAPP